MGQKAYSNKGFKVVIKITTKKISKIRFLDLTFKLKIFLKKPQIILKKLNFYLKKFHIFRFENINQGI